MKFNVIAFVICLIISISAKAQLLGKTYDQCFVQLSKNKKLNVTKNNTDYGRGIENALIAQYNDGHYAVLKFDEKNICFVIFEYHVSARSALLRFNRLAKRGYSSKISSVERRNRKENKTAYLLLELGSAPYETFGTNYRIMFFLTSERLLFIPE